MKAVPVCAGIRFSKVVWRPETCGGAPPNRLCVLQTYEQAERNRRVREMQGGEAVYFFAMVIASTASANARAVVGRPDRVTVSMELVNVSTDDDDSDPALDASCGTSC